MIYFDGGDLDTIFDLVAKYYSEVEEVPVYRDEKDGVEKLLGAFNGVRMDEFYPDVFDKASYLLTQINKGHFFSNGNKRLSLVCAMGFLAINNLKLQEFEKTYYRNKISKLFPSFKLFEDQKDFSPEEFAMYNLSIIIADSHKYVDDNFEILKSKVKEFFKFSITNW